MVEKILIILNTLGFLLLAAELLLRKRPVLGCLLTALAFSSFWYGRAVVRYLSGLGTDSFLEVQSFDLVEALGFLKTLRSILRPDSWEHFTYRGWLLLALSLASTVLVFKLLEVSPRIRTALAVLLVLLPVLLLGIRMGSVVNSNAMTLAKLKENFVFDESLEVSGNQRKLKLVVFVGESTSVMNLGIYGYFRDTTPELQKLLEETDRLLKFDNVFSTHVHTVPSLLEALSIKSGADDGEIQPIFDRKRNSLIDVLNEAGLETHLVSNQTRSGTWNMAGPVLFERATSTTYSLSTRLAGNSEWRLPRPEEWSFFKGHLRRLLEVESDSAIFLHSYIGHSYYQDNLPEDFDKPVDDRFSQLDLASVFGDSIAYPSALDSVQKSDSSYRYLDYVLSQVIAELEEQTEPVVLVYFSDHGDAVYAGLAHDSARFEHEMARVPFIVYFNEEAKAEYPDLFQDYLALSKSGRVSTLSQLSPTILNLLGVTIPDRYLEPLIGAAPDHSIPILVRETTSGTTYLNPFVADLENPGSKQLATPNEATRIFRMSADPAYSGTRICYGRSNSIAKALRGLLVTNCLEVDIDISEEGEMHTGHGSSLGPGLGNLFEVLNQSDVHLWLNAQNVERPERCMSLANFLSGWPYYAQRTLIALPWTTDFDQKALRVCADRLQSIGATVSYSLPTDLGMECVASGASHTSLPTSAKCKKFDEVVSKAVDSGLITEISFDIGLLKLVSERGDYSKLPWNTWGVQDGDIESYDQGQFNHITMDAHEDTNSIP
jgi:glucan phosphoethanolaminetransferase (alkaline phosphatase superfamily)